MWDELPVLYCTTLYYTVLYCTILCHTVLHYTILYHTVLHCTTLSYTVLHSYTRPIQPYLIKEQDLHGLFKEVHNLQGERKHAHTHTVGVPGKPTHTNVQAGNGQLLSLQISSPVWDELQRYSIEAHQRIANCYDSFHATTTEPYVQMNKPFSYVHSRNSGKVSSK